MSECIVDVEDLNGAVRVQCEERSDLEAQAAAMREALVSGCAACARGDRFVSESIHENGVIGRTLCGLNIGQRAALATDAGAPFLERLRQAEADLAVVDDDCIQYARRLEERLRQVEGGALAAMREAAEALLAGLEDVGLNESRRCDIPACNCGAWHDTPLSARYRRLRAALATDAGRPWLERLRQAEAERDQAQDQYAESERALNQAWIERDAARALLRQVEWADVVQGHSACRWCDGLNPELAFHPPGLRVGHAPDCALAKALGDAP